MPTISTVLMNYGSFNYLKNGVIPIYANAATLNGLQQRFAYAFQGRPSGWYRPWLKPYELSDKAVDKQLICNIEVSWFRQQHGHMNSLGYRIGKFAYSTDCNSLSQESLSHLDGVDSWIVDCLRDEASPSHSYTGQTMDWIDHVKPRLAVLTHMAHQLEYETFNATLPEHVVPGV